MSKKSSHVKSSPSAQPPDKSVATLTHVAQSFSGPLPHPEILIQYNQITPGFAERILAMAEREAAHRHAFEDQALLTDAEEMRRRATERRAGQICAFLIGIAALSLGTYAATHGAQIAGAFIGTGGIVGLVSAFLYKYQPQK